MNGQNTGAWSDVIRHCDRGAYPVLQPAPRSRRPRGELSRGNNFTSAAAASWATRCGSAEP